MKAKFNRFFMLHKQKINPFSVIMWIFLLIYSILAIYMLFWGIMTAFKEKWDFEYNQLGFPDKWVFSNFKDILTSFSVAINKTAIINGRKITYQYDVSIWEMCFNSITLVFVGGLIASIGPLLMGYMIGKFDNKFSKFLTVYIVFIMNFTVIGADPAAIQFRKVLGAYDNMLGHLLFQFGFTSINTLMYAGIFSGVSKAYADAAMLDGANEWTIMVKIMFPFAMNLFGTYFVIRMISVWNSYNDVLILIPSYPTIAYGTYLMSVSKDVSLADTPHRLSVAVLMVIPTTTIFVIYRNKFLNNVSIGGIKG